MKIRLILLSLLGIAAYVVLANYNSKMLKNPVPENHTRATTLQPLPVKITAPAKAVEPPALPINQETPAQLAAPAQTAAPQELADQQPETTPAPNLSEPPSPQLNVQLQTAPPEILQQLQAELAQKEQQVGQLLDVQEALAAKSRSLTKLLDAGTADIAAKDRMLQTANNQIKTLAADNNTTTAELERAKSTIEQLNTTLNQLKAGGIHAEQAIKEKETLIKTVQQQIQEQNAEADRLKAQVAATAARLQAARADLEQANLKAAALLREGQEKEQLTTTLEQQKKAMEISLQEKAEALAEVLSTLQALKQEVAGHPQALAAVQNMLDERNTAFELLAQATSAQIEQLSQKIIELGKKDNQTETAFNKCKAEASGALKKVAELESTQALAQTALREVEQKLAAALNDRNTLHNQLADKEAVISGIQGQMNSLLAKSTALNDEKIGLAKQLEALQADQSNLQGIKTAFEEKSAALAGAETKLKELAALQTKNGELTKSLEEKTTALADAVKQGKELTALQAQLAELQTKNKALTVQSEADANTIQQLESKKSGSAGQVVAPPGKSETVEILKKSQNDKTDALMQTEPQNKELAKADAQIAALQAQVKETADAQQALQTAKQAAEKKVVDAEAALKTLNQSLVTSSGKEKTLTTELAAAQVRIKELSDKNYIQQQQDLVPNLNQQVETLRNQVAQMVTTEALAKKNLAEMTAATQATDKKIQALQTEKDGLQKQLDEVKKQPQPPAPQPLAASAHSNVQDRDQDGVADAVDLCPDSPAGMPVNALGCPEKKGLLLEGVAFKSNTALLLPDGLKNLDRIAASLAPLAQVKIEIAGHTDSVGDPKRNLELSTLRAQTVAKYLAEKGVAKERITAKGYGQEKPIADNTASVGRQKNRRIELYLLAQ